MKVYKYRGGDEHILKRDLNSLKNDFFWASTRDLLNDPCEGLYSDKPLQSQLDSLKKIFIKPNSRSEKALEKFNVSLEFIFSFVDKSGIYSMSRTPLDELLWAHYAASHTGFCIEYESDVLMNFGKMDNDYFNVNYSNSLPKITINDIIDQNLKKKILQKILATKSKKWVYEKEVRIVTSSSGEQYYDFRSVKGIYFGLRMPNKIQEKMMGMLSGRNIKYYRVKLSEGSYKFSAEEITDTFANEPTYKYSVAPIEESAIASSAIDSRFKKHKEYLYKAAEIIRREPYCDLVETVDFSFEKSTEDNPIIFGQYRRSESKYVTDYFTLDEIDHQYRQIQDLYG